ncbi:uncharacterized protein LOC125044497 [Penaeus chinensis]|uniref:uncharacterized protein LOC125044497 n=1 Tax=Penaeus chinensis TaxID=139456 RepID=UPI001FB700BD|nr:uncharacterized protein LOC125044497 [Penaeus chinensis]
MSVSAGSERGQQEAPSGISVKISPVRRLCRLDSGEGVAKGEESHVGSVVACPSVLRQLSGQLRAPTRGVRGGGRALPSLATIRSRLVSRPYWRRCLCSPTEVPTISERELAPLLALTPAHRFIVLVVTNTNADSLGSVVVGGESLVQAVYATQNVAGLRPCLQSPSEPSLAFIKYDLARPRGRRRDKKVSSTQTLLNAGHLKIGMVLIYQKTRMLYSGFPLASYGCRMQDFLGFISKHTQYDFKLRAGFPDAPLSAPAGQTDLYAAAS